MAVSFKVPSSPKKSVFEIDNFLGVDLTNTGSNIDEVRSPNAENMVRYVPGKVRKRTGYKTQIEFSTGVNVNRIQNSSSEYKEIEFGADGFAYFYIYDEDIQHYSAKFDYELVGEYWVYAVGGTYSYEGFPLRSEGDTPVKDTYSLFRRERNAVYFKFEHRSSGANDYIKIKNFMACHNTDAETSEQWKVVEWTPAPEDDGRRFVLAESNEPIYGVHNLKIGTFDGNRVIGVNRAKNTSSNWQVAEAPSQGQLYYIYFYDYIPKGVKVKVQFEWDNPDEYPINVYIGDSSQSIITIDTSTGTYSSEITLDDNASRITMSSYMSGWEMNYRNLIVSYSTNDEDVSWNKAPEDDGDTFDTEDVYTLGETNLASTPTFVATLDSSTSGTYRILSRQIQTQAGVVGDYTYISFVATASATNDGEAYTGSLDGRIKTSFVGSSNHNYYYFVTNSDNIVDEKYNIVLSLAENEYVEILEFNFPSLSSSPCILECSVRSIEVRSVALKQTYDTFSAYHLYHVGSKMFMRKGNNTDITLITSDMNRNISKSWQIGKYLYIIDGKKYRRFNKFSETIEEVYGIGYIPTVAISKEPSGGGVSNEPFNMLQPAFIDTFLGTDTAVNYQLSVGELDDTPVRVWVMNSVGELAEKAEGVDFVVHRYDGIISFNSAPGTSPVSGEDNVKIQAYKTISDYSDRINKCTIGTLFGVNGESDRLFLSGNSDHKNWDFFSERNDPTYFYDTGYSSLGLETSAIVGYSKVNNYLATHKDEFETEQNVLVREGDLITRIEKYGTEELEYSDPAFKLINTIQGAGAIGKYTFGNLQTEPVFLTKSGIYAITPQDLTGEKYGQNRSFYLNGKLLKEENLSDAYATVYNDMYVLSVNDKLYILDGLQSIQTDKSAPYATRQYVGYYCTDVPANIIFTQDDALWIGTHDGKICRFATDIEALDSYNDDGKPIYCCWETPDLDGRLFYKNKTFRYFAIRMMQALKTSVKLYSEKLGAWTFIKEDTSSGIVFDFENIDFELFSFSTDTSEKVVHTKMRVKKVDKARFRVENSNINEPFGLFNLALEYVESGNYKG